VRILLVVVAACPRVIFPLALSSPGEGEEEEEEESNNARQPRWKTFRKRKKKKKKDAGEREGDAPPTSACFGALSAKTEKDSARGSLARVPFVSRFIGDLFRRRTSIAPVRGLRFRESCVVNANRDRRAALHPDIIHLVKVLSLESD